MMYVALVVEKILPVVLKGNISTIKLIVPTNKIVFFHEPLIESSK